MRKRPPVCAGLALMGRHLLGSKIEERTVTYDVIVIGAILADLAIDGSTRYPIGLFSPERLAARE
jgi:hypothetical protein